MGTPEFAVEPLRELHQLGYNIVAVVTMPDKPAGRGQKLTASAVKQFAVNNNLPILQPERLKDETFIKELERLNVDLGIVVAFKMLPQVIWAMPKLGTFNLHTSLLPQYRGAAPINWAIINGDTQTGVTTFMLDKDIDTGAIIGNKKTDISSLETAGNLHDKLMRLGADLVIETVDKIASGDTDLIIQSSIESEDLRSAPKIFKEDCKIDWSRPIDDIYNKIRGLSPYPAAWCELDGHVFKIFETAKELSSHSLDFGKVVSNGKDLIKVACNGGYIIISQLQLSGKKRMETIEFLRGFRSFDK